MFAEDELLPISALQHLRFCPRQCALIHIERAWAENRFTVEGRQVHERAHGGGDEMRGDCRVARAVPLRSLRLGLFGVADVVEFRPQPDAPQRPTPFPIEYKRGRRKQINCDRVQLCAQALCLEEMLGVAVPAGAIFYAQTRRREEVPLTDALRRDTDRAVSQLHELIDAGRIPVAEKLPKCNRCSLKEICLPEATGRRTGAAGYIARFLNASAEELGPLPAEDGDEASP